MSPEETHELIESYLQEANNENAAGTDRGLVLVWASIIDDVLEKMLNTHLVPLNGGQRDELFGPMGPLGTFSNRTKMMHALGLIRRDEMEAINQLRGIRNKFAHRLGVTLSDKDLAERSKIFCSTVCGESYDNPRVDFGGGCGSLLMILVNRWSRITTTPTIIDDRELPDRAYGNPAGA